MASDKNPQVNKLICLAGTGRPAGQILREQVKKQIPEQFEHAEKIIKSLEAGQRVKELPNDIHLKALFRPNLQPYLISWLKIDPALEIAKLNIPILVLHGDKDLQVSTVDAELQHKQAKQGKLKIIQGMNHVLKKTEGNTLPQQFPAYTDPKLPLHPELGSSLMEFINADN